MVSSRHLFLVVIFGFLPPVLFAQTATSPSIESTVPTQGERAFTDWARRNAIPLETTTPGNEFSDMAPLGGIVGDARIVELGEATHGASEFFQMKDRMVRYLAAQKGFTVFSIEANMPEAYRLNDFVLNGNGDPKALLEGMSFWTWNTQEILDMILWMRQYNQSGKGRIEFTGFDMQSPAVSLDTVRQFVSKYDPANTPEIDQVYGDIGKNYGPAFAYVSAKLPLSIAVGHRITLTGYIKTENIQDGYAGFWLRADGLQKALVFDGMDKTGPKGTTPWMRYDVTITVPADAIAVYLGMVHQGSGTAWFDSLQIAIDGVPYCPPELDLDFESSTLSGFHHGGNGYKEEIDATVAHTGKQSLRIDPSGASTSSSQANEEQSRQLQLSRGVLDDLESRRGKFTQSGASPKEIDWAIQNARLVTQYEEMKTDGVAVRDRAMAENIEWIANQNPSAKIIIWATTPTSNIPITAERPPWADISSGISPPKSSTSALFSTRGRSGLPTPKRIMSPHLRSMPLPKAPGNRRSRQPAFLCLP